MDSGKKYNDFIGVDVSKDKIDISRSSAEKIVTVKNDAEAIREYIENLGGKREGVLAVIDLTGGYEAVCVSEFRRAGFDVAVAEGFRVRSFARTIGVSAKTDSIDARVLCEYGRLFQDKLRLYEPKNKALRKLVERIYDLKAVLQEERNRAKAPDTAQFIVDDVKDHIQFLEEKVESLSGKLEEMVKEDKELNAKYRELLGMKGIGRTSGLLLVVMLPELGGCNRREIAALSGVAPIARDSGTYSGHRFTRRGRPNVKKVLFMCALVASRYDKKMGEFSARLIAKGKPKKVALVAVMRKLVVIANSRCKSLNKITNLG